MKIYIVGNSKEYANWIPNRKLVDSIEEADLVLFTGGEDVDPKLYKEKEGSETYTNPKRDDAEMLEYSKAKQLDKPMLGICRGAQFLCVMANGSLVQHMAHPRYHNIQTIDGLDFTVNSLHHQMQYPFSIPKNDYVLIGASYNLSPIYLNGDDFKKGMPSDEKSRFIEPEVVYYKKIKALGIQSHPEMMSGSTESNKYFVKLVNILVDGDTENSLEDLSIKGITVDSLFKGLKEKAEL